MLDTLCIHAPPCHQRCWLLNWMLITCWKVSLHFSPEDTSSRISNKNVKFGLFNFKAVYFKWALAPRTWWRFWTMFTYGFLFSFSWHLQIARQIAFTDSGFWKYSWAHLVISMTESCRWVMQCRLRPPKTTGIQQKSSALSLTQRDLSSFIFWWCYAFIQFHLLRVLCTRWWD